VLEQKVKKRKKIFVFSSFLLFSILMWLLIRLSETYTETYTFNLILEKIPPELWLLDDQNNYPLKTSVSTNGFKQIQLAVLENRLKKGIPVSLNTIPWEKKNHYSFSFKTRYLTALIAEKLDLAENEIRFHDQDMIFSASSTVGKKVALHFLSPIQPKAGYALYGDISMEPDSIWIHAPAEVADTIRWIGVSSNLQNPLHKTITQAAYIELTSNLIKPAIEQLTVTIPIEPFTEKRFIMPVQQEQSPVLKLFPDEVEVILRIFTRDFDQINTESLKVILDTNGLQAQRQFLRLNIAIDHPYAELIQLMPNKVEYLILMP